MLNQVAKESIQCALNIYKAKMNAADLVLEDVKEAFRDSDVVITQAVATHKSQRVAYKAEFNQTLANLIDKITKTQH